MATISSDVIIVIYNPRGERVTRAQGDEKALRLWRNRWVRGGYTARQIDAAGEVREYEPDEGTQSKY
jgi:hypothetical protein